ncbi:MAG: Ig-like domain-containing protein [Planctomycetota bacterium]
MRNGDFLLIGALGTVLFVLGGCRPSGGGSSSVAVGPPAMLAAVDDELTTTSNVPIVIDVLANDIDPRGGALTIDDFQQPLAGATQLAGPNAIRFSPAADFVGTDRFTYRVRDALGNTAQAEARIAVLGFQFQAMPQTLSYYVESGVGAVVVPFALAPDASNPPAQPAIVWFSFELAHDSRVLRAVGIAPSAALAALNGGAGPEDFATELLSDRVRVTVLLSASGAASLDLSFAQEIVRIEYETRDGVLRGDAFGGSTELHLIAGAIEERVTAVVAPIDLAAPVLLTFAPLWNSTGFHYLAPGREVTVDASVGVATFLQSLTLAESAPAGATSVFGFSMGIAHDATLLEVVSFGPSAALAALNGGNGPDFLDLDIHAEGVTAGVLIDFAVTETLLAAPPIEVLTVAYATQPLALTAALAGAGAGGVSTELQWTDALGVGIPVENIVVVAGALAITPLQVSGVIEFRPAP